MSEEKIGVSQHNVSINISSNNARLVKYAREHLRGLARQPLAAPDIDVRCQWIEQEWQPEQNPFEGGNGYSFYGKRMLGKRNELIWLNTLRMKGLQLRFRRENGRFLFDIVYSYHPKRENIESQADDEYRKYFNLMNYIFYYPLFWYLENFRNWTPLHASALDTAYGGVLVGGPGGVGKTTTCLALLQHTGARLISENIVLTDGQLLYPCYEPVRLNNDSIDTLSEKFSGLHKMSFPENLQTKSLYHFDIQNVPVAVQPTSLFMPEFSDERFIERMPSDIAVEKLLAANRLALEIDDYYWYASALEMTWPKVGQMHMRSKVLAMLINKAQCFTLGIDRTQGVEAVVKDIMGSMKEEFLITENE
ncbi:MAG: hypothetical protein H6695_09170 [Deferribacteres bacterium]|nr:hypothetical protein [candidate division KSB1 bacterium]MCB9510341.1 hypothetical protein [Deferribacteres bacterium]